MDQHVQEETVEQTVENVEQAIIMQQHVIHVHGQQEHINVIVMIKVINMHVEVIAVIVMTKVINIRVEVIAVIVVVIDIRVEAMHVTVQVLVMVRAVFIILVFVI